LRARARVFLSAPLSARHTDIFPSPSTSSSIPLCRSAPVLHKRNVHSLANVPLFLSLPLPLSRCNKIITTRLGIDLYRW
jgi:hypothetical protein